MAVASAALVCQKLYNRLEEEGYKETALKIFNSVSSDEDRVATCLRLMETFEVSPPKDVRPPSDWSKSFREAMNLKSKGNAEYSAKEYFKALLLYTRCIATSPMVATEEDPETRCLALAFANRSAALWHLGKYKDCIQDIDNALHVGYPWELKSKLFLRRGKCEKLLGMADAAKESFQMASSHLQFCEFSPDKRLVKEIDDWLKDVSEITMQLAGTILTDTTEEQTLPLPKNGSSKKILSASKCVDIAYLPSMGRHLIATEPIDPGDVLVVDKAYSSVLFQGFCYTHCYNCLKRSLVLIPCVNCTKVMFCSEDCRDKGWKNYHIIECPILPYLYQMQVGRNGLLALKTVLKLFLTQDYLNLRKKIFREANLEVSLRGFDAEGAYDALNYDTIFWLMTNPEEKSQEELFENSVLASYVVQVLETYTSFFNLLQVQKLLNEGLRDVGNVFGSLILRHLRNFPCNAHSVVETIKSNESFTEEVVEIGAAVYGTLSLINHSCDPNVGRFSHNGDTGVLRAIKPIAPGEQLFDNYGYHYSLMDKESRQKGLLCYYQFHCNCQACCEEWPLYSDQPRDTPTFICNKCKATLNDPNNCSKCGTPHNLTEIETYVQQSSDKIEGIIKKLQDGITISEGDIMMLIKHLKMLGLNIKLPWQKYCAYQEALKHYFSKMGNYFSVY